MVPSHSPVGGTLLVHHFSSRYFNWLLPYLTRKLGGVKELSTSATSGSTPADTVDSVRAAQAGALQARPSLSSCVAGTIGSAWPA